MADRDLPALVADGGSSFSAGRETTAATASSSPGSCASAAGRRRSRASAAWTGCAVMRLSTPSVGQGHGARLARRRSRRRPDRRCAVRRRPGSRNRRRDCSGCRGRECVGRHGRCGGHSNRHRWGDRARFAVRPSRLPSPFRSAARNRDTCCFPGRRYCGELVIADIGISDAAVAAAGSMLHENTPALWQVPRARRARAQI